MFGRRTGGRWWILVNVILVNFVCGGVAWNYITIVVHEVLIDLDLEVGDWGVLWSGIALGALALSIPAGALGDRFGPRRPVAGGIALGGASLLLRAAASDFGTMFVSMVLFGFGLGLLTANLPKMLGMWFPPGQLGLANGVSLAGFGAGQGTAALVTPLIADRMGTWRDLTEILGYSIVVLAVYWLLAVRDVRAAPPGSRPPRSILDSMARVLRVRDVWLVALCYLLYIGGHLGAVGYLPTYFTTQQGMSLEAAGAVISLASWSFIIGSATLPAFSDRIGVRRVVYVASITVIGMIIVAEAYLLGLPLALATIVWGFAAGAVGLLFVVPVEMDRVGPELAGTAIGVATAAGFAGGTLFPAIGLTLAEARPVVAFAFFSGCYLLSALLFAIIRETGPRRHCTDEATVR
jgi:NNP family nitrate/nitrite transporter-like MFS transporter